MSEIIFAHGGTLDKYIGDGLMAIFGAPTATPEDAKNALKTALRCRNDCNFERRIESEGFSRINVGIGLHTGEATVGYIGSEQRSEYTAIGDTVNLASRLESKRARRTDFNQRSDGGRMRRFVYAFSAGTFNGKKSLAARSLFEVKWN
jgi:class 3 adenylate cyclase